MERKAGWFVAAALGAAAVSALVQEPGRAQYPPPIVLPFQTGCAPVDARTVEGFVMNHGTGVIRIDGLVRFNFTIANSMSRPAMLVQGSGTIPPGRTVSVARARLIFDLVPGEACQFDVGGAVR